MSETSRSKAFLSKLDRKQFKSKRMETRLSDGLPDVLIVSLLTGKISFLESKEPDLNKKGLFKIDVKQEQAIFAFEYGFLVPNLRTYILCFLPQDICWLVPSENSVEWCSRIRNTQFDIRNPPKEVIVFNSSLLEQLGKELHGTTSQLVIQH